MNSVVLIGRLVRDPELRYAAETGTAFGSFTLAVDRQLSREKKQENESRGIPTADFIRITVFGKTAELCGNHLAKGRLVAVQGRITTGSYVNQQGQKVYTTDVSADRVQFLDWGDRQPGSGVPGQYQQNQYGQNQPTGNRGQGYQPTGQNQNFDDRGFGEADDDFIPFDDDSKIPF